MIGMSGKFLLDAVPQNKFVASPLRRDYESSRWLDEILRKTPDCRSGLGFYWWLRETDFNHSFLVERRSLIACQGRVTDRLSNRFRS